MKILLTGASGFIGNKILKALLEKYGSESVVVLSSKAISKVECFVYKSIRNFGTASTQFDDITHIIHAGAFIPKESSRENDLGSCFSNVEYTKNLLGHSFKRLKRFINLSTIDVYQECSGSLSENSYVSPATLYGSSKLFCEEMIKKCAEHHNYNYLNLRIGHVYGPGEEQYKKALPSFIRKILVNEPPEIWGDGSDLRSFIFIEDVVESVLNSVTLPQNNININIASGQPISILKLLQLVVAVSGKNISPRMKESSHTKKSLVFDNQLLLSTLLEQETNFQYGIALEYEYMKGLYENNM